MKKGAKAEKSKRKKPFPRNVDECLEERREDEILSDKRFKTSDNGIEVIPQNEGVSMIGDDTDGDVRPVDILNPDNVVKFDSVQKLNEVDWNETESKCDNKRSCDTSVYFNSDPGPYVVHLSRVNKEDESQICDIKIGKMLRDSKVQGVKLVKRIGKYLVKLFFDSGENANIFMRSQAVKEVGFLANIPLPNISKAGIVYDIPAEYTVEFLKENIASALPALDIYRFNKTVTNRSGERVTIPSNTIKITFRGQFLPDEVDFFLSKRKVKPFVSSVTRCYKCLRFGHIQKYCKQAKDNCGNCGRSHDGECPNPMKCFHCRSPDHHALSTDCPEYARNVLIKEAMTYRSISFFEANEEYPRINSHYSIAEKQEEFPKLGRPTRGMKNKAEDQREEQSFPRKSEDDLKLQYSVYVQKQRGVSSSAFSEVASKPLAADPVRSTAETPVQPSAKVISNNTVDYIMNERKLKFVNEAMETLTWTLNQIKGINDGPASSISNDLLLISISDKILKLFNDRNVTAKQLDDCSLADIEEST